MTTPLLSTALPLSINIKLMFGQLGFDEFQLDINQNFSLQGITGIFGHSGSGKSTLLRIISGLEKNVEGSITLNNTCLINSREKIFVKAENRNIGLIFQDSRLFPHLNVLENLTFSAKRCKQSRLDFNEIVALTDLDALLHKSIGELSGGQKQRVAFARAILAEPALLLLDEPLSALDRKAKNSLLTLMLKVQNQLQLPMLYVSHSLDELQQVCDKLLVLSQGKVIGYDAIHTMVHQLNDSNAGYDELTHQQTSLSLPIQTSNNGQGLAVLILANEQCIYLPALNPAFNDGDEKKSLRCFILANDISISLTEPINSSIVNHLLVTIESMNTLNNKVLITALFIKNNIEQQFFISISAFSKQRLALKINQQVYLQFKASAVRTYLY